MATQPARHKIIVGVDFGTTYTGVSFVNTAQTNLQNANDVTLIQDWPGPSRDSGEVCKTASRIAFVRENPKYPSDRWGFQVLPGMKSYSWLKLGLDKNIKITDFDDPDLETLEKSEGEGMFKFPDFLTPMEACAEFLTNIYTHTFSHLERRFTPTVFAQTPVEFWFTVPAIWSDEAMSATRRAASKAGFGSRSVNSVFDKVYMIPEPEAAAVATLRSLSRGSCGSDQLKAGMGVLVCDCGGGTVDITAYKIKAVKPRLEFEELVVGTGGKTGSTSIDRRFHAWMTNIFGDAFKKLLFNKIGPGSQFMKEFELWKRDFGNTKNLDEEFTVQLVMPEVEDSRYYDVDMSTVKFYTGDMLSFFRPAIDRITRLLEQQIEQVRNDAPDCPISLIILVGGFGDSAHLNRELTTWCKENGDIRLLCPSKPQAAIVRGAALRGLEGIKPSTRKCRRHYGFTCGMPFRKGVDSEKDAYRRQWDNAKYCKGRMDWQIKKGQVVDSKTKVGSNVYWVKHEDGDWTNTVRLYSYTYDDAPDRLAANGVTKVGDIQCDFSSIDLSKFKSKIKRGRRMWQLEYRVEALLGSDEGELQFRIVCGDEQLGTATIEYDSH